MKLHGRPLIVASVVAVAAASLLATGCGGGAPSVARVGTTTTTSAAAPSRGSGGELGQYASCMRAHGISNFPDLASFGTPAAAQAAKGQMLHIFQTQGSSPKFEVAQRACAKYYGPGTASPRVSQEEMQKLLAVSRCMRGHGVPNFPDPDPTGDFHPPASIDQNSPQAHAALRACSALGRAAGLKPGGQ